MGPIWGRQDPGGSLVGPMNFAIWVTAINPEALKWKKQAAKNIILEVALETTHATVSYGYIFMK